MYVLGSKKEDAQRKSEVKLLETQGSKRPLPNNFFQTDDYYDQFCKPSNYFQSSEK